MGMASSQKHARSCWPPTHRHVATVEVHCTACCSRTIVAVPLISTSFYGVHSRWCIMMSTQQVWLSWSSGEAASANHWLHSSSHCCAAEAWTQS
jgi:hypothetical protein